MIKYFAIVGFIIISSCRFFEPRTPEDPSNGGISWMSPTNPDIVIENMKSALEGKSLLYLDCFTESFVFYTDTNDINEYTTYNFANWNLNIEEMTIAKLYSLVAADSLVTAEFILDVNHPDPAAPTDSVTIYREYSITIPQSYYSGTKNPAVGIAEFFLIENSEGLWAVQEWHDMRLENAAQRTTWAVAKAYYR